MRWNWNWECCFRIWWSLILRILNAVCIVLLHWCIILLLSRWAIACKFRCWKTVWVVNPVAFLVLFYLTLCCLLGPSLVLRALLWSRVCWFPRLVLLVVNLHSIGNLNWILKSLRLLIWNPLPSLENRRILWNLWCWNEYFGSYGIRLGFRNDNWDPEPLFFMCFL